MQRFWSVALGLGIVALAIAIGAAATDYTHRLIRLLLPLPSVGVTGELILTAGTYVLVASLIVFALIAWRNPTSLFSTARRTAIQCYGWGAAWGFGSLYLFLMSSNVFPHQMLVGAFIAGLLLFWLGYASFSKGDGGRSFVSRLQQVVVAMFGLLKKPLAWLAVLLTIAPLVAAMLYVVSQDFRDAIADFRIRQNVSVEGDWITVPANTKTQLLQPIMIRMEPGRPDSMLVLERAGKLYRMGYPDNGTKELLLDFSEQVGEVNLENGALGFDFDPEYAQGERPYVYIYFTSWTAQKQTNYLARFDIAQPDPAARLASQSNLIALDRPATQYHNAGHVEVGADGFLYLSIGEMSLPEYKQSVDRSMVAGILRIDVLQQGGSVSAPIAKQPENGRTQGYFIPRDNPFANRPGAIGEYYALGLRNPFRFTIDRQTGDIWAGDVGSTVWEEVNLIRKGGNYQFPFIEGRERQPGIEMPDPVMGQQHGPVYTYRHTAYDRSVIGGIIYRGDRWPSLKGKYLFGDNYSGKFWAMPAVPGETGKVETLGQADQYAQRGFTSLLETPDGRILITIMGSASTPNGEIVELVPAAGGAALSSAGKGAVSAGAAAGPEIVDVAALKQSFVTNCARCHGETGHGDGPDAQILREQLGAAPTNFHTPAFKARSRAHVHKVLVSGGESVGLSPGMPPWEGLLTPEEIDAMTDYVMKLPEEGSQ